MSPQSNQARRGMSDISVGLMCSFRDGFTSPAHSMSAPSKDIESRCGQAEQPKRHVDHLPGFLIWAANDKGREHHDAS